MGSLAKYGALGGLGQGMQEASANKREERLINEKRSADEERQMRIAKWKSGEDDRRASERRDHEMDIISTTDELRTTRETNTREDDQAFRADQSELDRQMRRDIARIGAAGAGAASTSRMREWLLKGDDITMSTQQSPTGLETVTVTKHAPSNTTYQTWNTGSGSVNFPEGRDPSELAPLFNIQVGEGRKGLEAARPKVVKKLNSLENLLIKSIGTEDESGATEFFESKTGYLPLRYIRIKHAQSMIGG